MGYAMQRERQKNKDEILYIRGTLFKAIGLGFIIMRARFLYMPTRSPCKMIVLIRIVIVKFPQYPICHGLVLCLKSLGKKHGIPVQAEYKMPQQHIPKVALILLVEQSIIYRISPVSISVRLCIKKENLFLGFPHNSYVISSIQVT